MGVTVDCSAEVLSGCGKCRASVVQGQDPAVDASVGNHRFAREALEFSLTGHIPEGISGTVNTRTVEISQSLLHVEDEGVGSRASGSLPNRDVERSTRWHRSIYELASSFTCHRLNWTLRAGWSHTA